MHASFHATADAYYRRAKPGSPRTYGEGERHRPCRGCKLLNLNRRLIQGPCSPCCPRPCLAILELGRRKIAPCTEKETTAQLLECVLDKIEASSLFLDVHLLPQFYELLCGIMGCDTAVDIIDLSNIDAVARGCDGTRHKSRSRSRHLIWGYLQFHLTADALSEPILDRICRLYEATERILRGLGTTETLCDMRMWQL